MNVTERNSAKRILHVLVPFIIMVASQKLLVLIFSSFMKNGELISLISFLFSSALAVVFFSRQITHLPLDDDSTEIYTPANREPMETADIILCTTAAFAALTGAMYLITALFGYDNTDPRLSALTLLSVIVIHPIVEEYIFRKMFYFELRPLSPLFAVLLQAVMFAIIHSSVSSMMYALMSGMILGTLVELTGRLAAPIVAHLAVNLRSSVYLGFLSEKTAVQDIADIVIFALGAVCLAAVLIRLGIKQKKRERV